MAFWTAFLLRFRPLKMSCIEMIQKKVIKPTKRVKNKKYLIAPIISSWIDITSRSKNCLFANIRPKSAPINENETTSYC